MVMNQTKLFAASAVVFVVVTLSLLTAVNEQRRSIYASQTGGTRLSSGFGGSLMPGALAQEVTDNALFVSGSATASANPDKVTIMLSVETQDDSATKSQQDNADLTAAVRSALSGIGISAESVETTGYSLSQVREYDSQTRTYVNKGFKTVHSMKVELSDTSRAGEVIDAAVSAGANRINGVYFGLSDTKMKELRLQALEAASGNAKEKAESIAKGLGVTVKRVMSASESYGTPQPIYKGYGMEMAVQSAGAGAATEVTPGEVSVTASVSAVFEIG